MLRGPPSFLQRRATAKSEGLTGGFSRLRTNGRFRQRPTSLPRRWAKLLWRLDALKRCYLAVGQNQWYHFGVAAPPILVYFSGDWDVYWGVPPPTKPEASQTPRVSSCLLDLARSFNGCPLCLRQRRRSCGLPERRLPGITRPMAKMGQEDNT